MLTNVQSAALAVHLKTQFLTGPRAQQTLGDLRSRAEGLNVYANDDVSAQHIRLLANHHNAAASS